MAEARYSRIRQVICVAGIVVALCSLVDGKTIYVDDDTPISGDGSSWANAFKYLQDALTAAQGAEKPVEIRVAQGTCRPDQGGGIAMGDVKATFRLINGVTIRGGHAGRGQPDPNAWDPNEYETILSGDLDGDDASINDPRDLPGTIKGTNSNAVVSGSGTDRTAVLDGFTVTGCAQRHTYRNSSTPTPYGGLYNLAGSPTILNCTFTGNASGGMCNIAGSNPAVANCTFTRNYEAGMANDDSSPDVRDCTFADNPNRAMYNYRSGLSLVRCSFVGNTVAGTQSGGAIYSHQSDLTLSQCSFLHNFSRTSGGAIYADSNLALTDCIFTENAAKYSGAVFSGKGRLTARGCTFRGNSEKAVINESQIASVFKDCVFSGNSSTTDGGAVYVSNAEFQRCVFAGNSVWREGNLWSAGGAVCSSQSAVFDNCTFVHNRASRGCDVYAVCSALVCSVSMSNCIFRDSADPIYVNDPFETTLSVRYCDVQGGWAGEGNLDVDPLFADPGYWDPNGTPEDPSDDFFVEGDYHLKSQAGRWDPNSPGWVLDDVTSPCIDAGDPNSPVGEESFPNGGRVNVGAYGGTVEASKSLSLSSFSGKYGGGSGTEGDPYLIFTAEQFDAVGAEPADWDKHFKLMADIDLSGYPGHELHLLGVDETNPFSGVFDGDGHRISGLGRNSTKEYSSGALFGYLTGTVKAVGLIDPNVGGRLLYYTGTLVGDNHATVSNCYAHNVNVVGGGWYAGGLVGRNLGTIADCNSTGVVHDRSAGGLVGRNGGTITGSRSAAIVSGDDVIGGLVGSNVSGTISNSCSTGAVTGDDRTGGLVGHNYEGTITCCYSAAVVTGNDGVGGLVGENWQGLVTNCYSAANVTGDRLTAGLVGDSGGGAITNCYAVGPVIGRWPVGGVVSWRHDDDIVTGCFWDMETTGCEWSAAGTGKTTAQMQTAATFLSAGWDFLGETTNGTEDVWQIPQEPGYPRLLWEAGSK
jgi:predicted outer membrane repeat protein